MNFMRAHPSTTSLLQLLLTKSKYLTPISTLRFVVPKLQLDYHLNSTGSDGSDHSKPSLELSSLTLASYICNFCFNPIATCHQKQNVIFQLP